jgi:hypothetical protein
MPLSGPSVNLAGKPSRVGGTVASVFGWLILVMGLSIALGLGLLFAAFHLLAVALALALPLGGFALLLGGLLVRKGSTMNREGVAIERTTREQALLALAAHRGSIHAVDAARALGVSVPEADAMLTDLAKREPDHLAVDIEEQGEVAYRYVDARVRVGAEPRVDLDGTSPASPERGRSVDEPAAMDATEPLEEEERAEPPRPRTVPRT